MAMESAFFRDLAYVFGAAVVGGTAAKLLRQPLILGYVLGGFLIGPFTPGPTLSHVHEFEALAEIGVILLMYSIGLEFSFDELLQVKWVAHWEYCSQSGLVWGWDGCWAGARFKASPSARLFPLPAPWCSRDCWPTAENYALRMVM
jgi:hypothetical protein